LRLASSTPGVVVISLSIGMPLDEAARRRPVTEATLTSWRPARELK
jgi:hypothetical protein